MHYKPIDIIFMPVYLLLVLPFVAVLFLFLYLFESKPILFKQIRLGEKKKFFTVYKFRTLEDGYEKKHGLIVKNDNDSFTRFGKFLRLSSLDELPQIINIIRGDMSLVGPRPVTPMSPKKPMEYTKLENFKFMSKPGITGLAQINGRNSISMRRRFALDYKYFHVYKKFNILIDICIVLRTFLTIFQIGKNTES